VIDLHIHVLPAVDDGPPDLDEAAAMCRLAAEDGCTTLVVTPHQRCPRWWNADPAGLAAALRAVAARLDVPLDLRLGAEVRVDSGLLSELDRHPDSGLLPLAGSRYLLVEFDRQGLGPDPEPIVDELQAMGWRPVVAHPEFVPQLADDVTRTAALVRDGALLQITAASLEGRFGRGPKRNVEQLLDRGLVHFVASDGHDTRRRPPGLAAARELLVRTWGDEAARQLTDGNARSVLDDSPL
jgi:protein-tyrosine phosphatase